VLATGCAPALARQQIKTFGLFAWL